MLSNYKVFCEVVMYKMIIYEDLYNFLFALRVSLQDTFDNENNIIRELKLYLLDNGHNQDINIIIYNFYCYFDIDRR